MDEEKELTPLKDLEEKIKIKIKNKNLYYTALTHRSYLYFHPDHKYEDNERLEFLGDALLEFIISWYLYRNFPDLHEGDLTLIRAALVRKDGLLKIAEKINLEKFLLYGKSISEKGKKRILANAVEALLGAIFLDNDLQTVQKFIKEHFLSDLQEIIDKKLYKDPKSRLQEIFQERFKVLPKYFLIQEEGPPHNKKFKIGLYLREKLLSVGEGSSKQEAEVDAAIKTLKKIKELENIK